MRLVLIVSDNGISTAIWISDADSRWIPLSPHRFSTSSYDQNTDQNGVISRPHTPPKSPRRYRQYLPKFQRKCGDCRKLNTAQRLHRFVYPPRVTLNCANLCIIRYPGGMTPATRSSDGAIVGNTHHHSATFVCSPPIDISPGGCSGLGFIPLPLN